MKVVPTLCATSTLIGVSTAGYALALPESTRVERPASKRKFSSDLDRLMPSFRLPNNASHPFFSGSRPSLDAGQSRPSTDGRSSTKKARRKTFTDTAVSRIGQADAELAAATFGKDSFDFGSRLTLRTRPSWMKRFSTASSLESSPAASPTPDSPNGLPNRHTSASPAYSRESSNAPIVASQPTPPLPPNKLVKRSSSLRFNNQNGTGHRSNSSRRPATSHQRSSTVHDFSQSMRVGHGYGDVTQPGEHMLSDTRWRQFFAVKVSSTGAFPRKRGFQADVLPVKRIIPENGRIPHLISAKSILTTAMEVDEVYDHDDSSLFYPSRPASAGYGADNALQHSPDQAVPEFTNSHDGSGKREPQGRLSSFQQVLQRRPSAKRLNLSKNLTRTSSNKSARRVFSDPLAGLGITRTSIDSERPAKRRDISGPQLISEPSKKPPPNMDNSRLNGTGVARAPAEPSKSTPPNDTTHISHSTDRLPSMEQTASYMDQLRLDYAKNSRNASNIKPVPVLRSARANIGNTAFGNSSTQNREGGLPDIGSDHVFDYRRPKTNRSHSGTIVNRFETIYDESPPRKTVRAALPRDMPPPRLLGDNEVSFRDFENVVEEEDHLATPVRTIRSDRADDGSPVAQRLKIKSRSRSPLPPNLHLPSSPPEINKALSLGTLEYDDELPEAGDEARWSVFDDEADSANESSHEDWGSVEQVATPLAFKKSNPMLVTSGSSPLSTDTSDRSSPPFVPKPHGHGLQHKEGRHDLRSSLFDWSEQPADKSPANRSPPRPRTVHGKKDMDGRGSRSVGRRVHSGLHVRSQSVPVVPDLAGKRETVVTNKFGTWGVGSKGVSEDWNDDFDFEDDADGGLPDEREEKRIDSGVAMRIPQLIREHQVNVVNNIGLVREFGILVEELKTLRIRASKLGLLDDPRAEIWEEIEAMIDLADQEAEEPVFPPRMSPPSSPGFNSEAFDESAEPSLLDMHVDTAASTPFNSRSRRKSVLPSDSNDIFDSPSAPQKNSPASVVTSATPRSSLNAATGAGNRPRKDSEAMARSVIEALKNRNTIEQQPLMLNPIPPTKKVPFDTNTLRHIVPYVSGLVRAVKNQLKDVERLTNSPDGSLRAASDPTTLRAATTIINNNPQALSDLFLQPPESPSARKSRRQQAQQQQSGDASADENDNVVQKSNAGEKAGLDEVNNAMKLMTVM